MTQLFLLKHGDETALHRKYLGKVFDNNKYNLNNTYNIDIRGACTNAS